MEIFCGLISSNCSLAEEMEELLITFEDVNFSWHASTYDHALEHLLNNPPTIVFLDLDSSEHGNPFLLYHELFMYLKTLPSFIAVSGTKKHSYEVIKRGMKDYLLYPLSEFELRKSFMKYFKNNLTEESQKICIKSNSDYRYIDMKDIVYLKADNNTTDIFLQNGGHITAYKTLKFFEHNLPSDFLRVHNSYIINITYIIRINFGKTSIVLNGVEEYLPFSKSYRGKVETLKEKLKSTLRIVA